MTTLQVSNDKALERFQRRPSGKSRLKAKVGEKSTSSGRTMPKPPDVVVVATVELAIVPSRMSSGAEIKIPISKITSAEGEGKWYLTQHTESA